MFVGVLQVDLGIPGAFSLKDKRRVVKSVLERIRRSFGVTAAEVGDLETWNRARLGIAFVSNDRRHAESQLGKVVAALSSHRDAVVVDHQMEIL